MINEKTWWRSKYHSFQGAPASSIKIVILTLRGGQPILEKKEDGDAATYYSEWRVGEREKGALSDTQRIILPEEFAEISKTHPLLWGEQRVPSTCCKSGARRAC